MRSLLKQTHSIFASPALRVQKLPTDNSFLQGLEYYDIFSQRSLWNTGPPLEALDVIPRDIVYERLVPAYDGSILIGGKRVFNTRSLSLVGDFGAGSWLVVGDKILTCRAVESHTHWLAEVHSLSGHLEYSFQLERCFDPLHIFGDQIVAKKSCHRNLLTLYSHVSILTVQGDGLERTCTTSLELSLERYGLTFEGAFNGCCMEYVLLRDSSAQSLRDPSLHCFQYLNLDTLERLRGPPIPSLPLIDLSQSFHESWNTALTPYGVHLISFNRTAFSMELFAYSMRTGNLIRCWNITNLSASQSITAYTYVVHEERMLLSENHSGDKYLCTSLEESDKNES